MTVQGGRGPAIPASYGDEGDAENVRPDLLLQHLPCGYIQCQLLRDANGEARDARVLRANPALGRILGLTLPDIVGCLLSELASVASPGLAAWWAALSQAVSQAPVESAPPREKRLSVYGVAVSLLVYHAGPDQFAATVSEVVATPEPAGRVTEQRAVLDLYRLACEKAPRATIIMALEGEHGRVIDVNDAACHLTGYRREELLRLSPNHLIAPEYCPLGERALRSLGDGGHAVLEAAIVHRDGVSTPVEVTANRQATPTGQTILALLCDTSGQVQTEETLRQREQELRALVATTDDIVLEIDAGFRFANVWARDESLLFAPRERLLGCTLLEVFGEEHGSAFAAAVEQAMQSGAPVTIEYQLPNLSSWFSARIAPVDGGELPAKRSIVTVRDITAHRQADEQLRRSEEEFRGLWEHSPIALELYDRDGWVVRANQAALDMFGVPSFEGVRGYNLFDDPSIPDDDKRAMRRGEPVHRQFQYSLDAVRSLGLYNTSRSGTIDVDSYISPLSDERGAISGYVVHIQDITERAQARAAIEESERRYRAIVEDQLELVVRYLPDSTITFANDAFCRSVGLPRELVIGTKNWPACVPGDEPLVGVPAEWFTPRRPVRTSEHRTVTPSGELRWQQWSDRAFFDDAGNVVELQSVGRDITELVRARESLEQSEQRYRGIVEDQLEMVVRYLPDCTITYANAAYCQSLGLPPEQVIGTHAWPPSLPGDEAAHHVGAEWFSRERPVRTSEHRVLAPDGQVRWQLWTDRAFFDSAGDVTELQSVGWDITELFEAREALRESEERYRLLAEHMQDTIFYHDMDGMLRYVNPAVEALTGYSVEDFLSRRQRASDRVHPEDREMAVRHWSAAIESAVASHVEYRVLTKSNECRWVSASFGPVYDEQGHQVGAQTLVSDITDRRRLQEQLLQAQKMESIGRLAGGVAHDFNNILTAINGYAEFVLEQLEEDAEVRGDVLEIIRNTERASNLTRQLLAFSRKQTMAMRPTDLNALVSELGRMFSRLIGEHIDLVLAPGASMATVQADPAQIEQVLANLAVNARDAMPRGGTLTIATSNVHRAVGSNVGRPNLPPGDYVCLEVTDTGQGMSQDVLDHLFEPFFTTKEVGKGTGLGLATIYGIVKQHGGDIVTRSEEGQGSVFSVYLPVAPDQAGQALREPIAVAARGDETVLLVEDEAAVRTTLRRALERLGYQIIEASNGAEAIEVLSQTGARPALVITDLVMPQMGGLELARALRAAFPTLRVLFTSGYTENAAALTSAVDAGNFYLQKPFNVAELSAKVREALGRT